jgi:folate-dependent phosphoribosylglycinamide formyltransferase PurN
MRVVLFAPIANSFYARLVADGILKDPTLDLVGIANRSILNIQRFRSEFQRDGARLLRKIQTKLISGDQRFPEKSKINMGTYAKEQGLSYKTLSEISKKRKTPLIRVRSLNSKICQDFVKGLNSDVIAFTGGGLIRQAILDLPSIGVVNCHSGILPQYRGMDVVEWTAAEGSIQKIGFGASLHLMDKGVDTGPILMKENVELDEGDTFTTIRDRIEVLMVRMMLAGLHGLAEGSIQPVPQEASSGKQYYVMHPRILELAERNLRSAA